MLYMWTRYMFNTTVSNWFGKFRALSAIFYLQDASIMIDEKGEIVEIDENYFIKRKYHKGRSLLRVYKV